MPRVRMSLIAFAASAATIPAAYADVVSAASPSFAYLGAPAPAIAAPALGSTSSKSVVTLGAPAVEKAKSAAVANEQPAAPRTSSSFVVLGEPVSDQAKPTAVAIAGPDDRPVANSVIALGEPAVEEFKVAAIDRKTMPAAQQTASLSPHLAGKERLDKIKFGVKLRDRQPGPGAHANSNSPMSLAVASRGLKPDAPVVAAVAGDGFAEPGRHANASPAAQDRPTPETGNAKPEAVVSGPEPGRHAGTTVVDMESAADIRSPASVTTLATYRVPAGAVFSSMVDFGAAKAKSDAAMLTAPASGVSTSTSIIMFGAPTAEDIRLAALPRNRRRMSGPVVIRGGVVGSDSAAPSPSDNKAAGKPDAENNDAAAKDGDAETKQDAAGDQKAEPAAAADTSPETPVTQEAAAKDTPSAKPHSNPHRKPEQQ